MNSDVPHAEAMLAHTGFVRHVARAALHGDRDVDDVVQETWIAALQSAPLDPTALKAWLGGIVRRQSANRIRREVQTRRREASVARPDRAPSTAEMAARAEVGRALVDAVLALEEPYRRAVLLRYQEGLPPREIAKRLDLPVETVRTRVKRGLATLRSRLERAYGDREGGPVPALLLLAGPPVAHVLPSAVAGIGGVIMAQKVLAAAVALVVLVGAGIFLVGGGDDAVKRDVSGVPLPLASHVVEGELPRLEGQPVARQGSDAVDAPWPEGLPGIVVRKDTGEPVAGVPVYVVPPGPGRNRSATRTDAAGRFGLADTRPGEVSVFALGAGWVSARLPEVVGEGFDPTIRRLPLPGGEVLRLEVAPCAIVEGIVLDADGKPVAGATIQANHRGRDARPLYPNDPRRVEAGKNGVFVHDALVPGWACAFVAWSPAHAYTRTKPVTLRPGRTNDRVEIRFAVMRALEVRVLDAETAEPIPSAEIHAAWLGSDTGWTTERAWKTDETGLAVLAPVPATALRLEVDAPGYLSPDDPVSVPAVRSEDGPLEIRLHRGVTIRGRVVVPPDADTTRIDVEAESLTPDLWCGSAASIEEDGSFELSGLRPGRYRVQASLYLQPNWFIGTAECDAPGGGIVLELKPNRGPFFDEPREHDHRLETVALVVLTPSGTPVEEGWIRYFDGVAGSGVDLEEGPQTVDWDRAGEGLYFEASDLGEDEDGTPLAAGTYGPVKPVGGVITLRIEKGVSIRGRVTMPDGKGVAGVHVEAVHPGLEREGHRAEPTPVTDCHTDEDGAFDLQGLRRERWYVRCQAPPGFALPVPLGLVAGGPPIEIRLESAVRVPLRVLDDEGRPLPGAKVTVIVDWGLEPARWVSACETTTDETGVAQVDRVVAGRTYGISVNPPMARWRELLWHLADDWVAEPGVIRLETGFTTTGTVLAEDGSPAAGAHIWWWDETTDEPYVETSDAEGRFRIGPTKPGRLHLLVAEGGVETPSDAAPPTREDATRVEAGATDVTLVVP